MVWVHPYQARVSMIDDVTKQLAQLVSTEPDWPYALGQLNRDAHHMPLPTEGHLSVMTKRECQQCPLWNDPPIGGFSKVNQVDLSQPATKEQESKAPSLDGSLSPIPAASPTRPLLHKAEGQISMTMEVSELLSWAVLDTSGLASGSSTPKRPGSLAFTTPLPLKPKDSIKPVDTSSQVSIPDDMEMDDPTLEEIHDSPSPLVKT